MVGARRAASQAATDESLSVPVVLRAAPIATFEELSQPDIVRHHEMYERGALKPRPGLDVLDVPILVDHIKDDTPIGRVRTLRTDECWTGGTWLWVHADIDDPPGWLRKGSGVSIARSAFHTRDLGAGWDLICKALLNEVSILSPGSKPAFPRAQVVWIGERQDSPAVRQPTSDRAAGELFYGDGTTITRHGIGQVLGVR